MRGAEPPRYVSAGLADDLQLERPLPAHVVKYATKREPPIIEPWRCWGPCRGEWTDRGSYALKACTRCGTPRPK